jgi:tRNA modification GTPase
MHDLDSTLVVVGTPPGRGGIGCVRLSGAQAERIGRSLFLPHRDPKASGTKAPVFGRLLDRNGRPIDHGFLVVFPAARAYTGEPSVELWSHGSPAVLAELVDSAMSHGALPAGPGEFTYRAWRNGRLDLSQAEAIRDLIDARTAYQARIAFSQAEGALSRRLTPLRSLLEEWLVRGEAAVEFVDEPETAVPLRQLTEALELAHRECRDLLSTFDAGRIVRTGAVAAIIGPPNVGKSSLFNRLLGRERAIVTPTPGTTRDTVEEEIDLAGIPARIVDTAGLRRTDDPVESEGLRRAEVARREADVILLVLDGSCPLNDAERRELDEASTQTLVVRSKSDLPQERWQARTVAPIAVSAKTGDGIAVLRAALLDRIRGTGPLEDPILTNARHAEAIRSADAALSGALDAVRSGIPEDLVLEDVKLALRHLAGITGEFTTEQLLDRIFSTFCIGK